MVRGGGGITRVIRQTRPTNDKSSPATNRKDSRCGLDSITSFPEHEKPVTSEMSTDVKKQITRKDCFRNGVIILPKDTSKNTNQRLWPALRVGSNRHDFLGLVGRHLWLRVGEFHVFRINFL